MTYASGRPSQADVDALLPPSAFGKPLAVGGTIALVGAAVWALLIAGPGA